MPWMPITAQPHDEERPAVMAGGVRVEATGTVATQDIPAAGDLSIWVWDQYRLESDLAGRLGFSVGSIEASRNTRTLIAEFSRSKTVATDGTNACFGVAARLIVNVSGLDAKANLTLPFVAAEAQYNRVEAYANLRVAGYVGPDTGEMFPDFTTFDVESYVTLMQSLSALRKVIGAKEEFIRPTRLWAWAEEEAADATDRRLTQGVATAWALTQIADGHPREQALAKYRDSDDTVAQAMIDQTLRPGPPSGTTREKLPGSVGTLLLCPWVPSPGKVLTESITNTVNMKKEGFSVTPLTAPLGRLTKMKRLTARRESPRGSTSPRPCGRGTCAQANILIVGSSPQIGVRSGGSLAYSGI